jgi:hypothetical protein
MIGGESQSFAGATPLAHWLLFFIIGDCSLVIRYEQAISTSNQTRRKRL